MDNNNLFQQKFVEEFFITSENIIINCCFHNSTLIKTLSVALKDVFLIDKRFQFIWIALQSILQSNFWLSKFVHFWKSNNLCQEPAQSTVFSSKFINSYIKWYFLPGMVFTKPDNSKLSNCVAMSDWLSRVVAVKRSISMPGLLLIASQIWDIYNLVTIYRSWVYNTHHLFQLILT